jgi:hypothetical protein
MSESDLPEYMRVQSRPISHNLTTIVYRVVVLIFYTVALATAFFWMKTKFYHVEFLI